MKPRTICFYLAALILCVATDSVLVAQWVQTSLKTVSVQCLTFDSTNLLAGASIPGFPPLGAGVFLSANNGTSWATINSGLTNLFVRALAVSGTKLFAGTDGGVFLSTNDGTNWTAVNTGLTNTYIRALAVSGANLFAGGDGIFLSTNNGTNWTEVRTGLTNPGILVLAVSGTNLFAGTDGGGVLLSTNNGTSWTAAGLSKDFINSLAVSGTNVLAGTSGGIYRTTDNGANWTPLGFPNFAVMALAVSGTHLFAGTLGNGVYLSTNNDTNWAAVNTGLTNTYVRALAVSSTNLFAGTFDGGVWRRPLSEMITSVEMPSADMPIVFSLSNNYPNPFNPSTIIRFSLPHSEFVTLRIFNALGEHITTLVSGYHPAGSNQIKWNAQDLPTGVYFYRMHAGSFIATKKLILLR